METISDKEVVDILMQISHYYILGADLLLYRANPFLKNLQFSDQKTKYKIRTADESVQRARKLLDTFEDIFIRAADGDTETYDAYTALTYEMIAFNIAYLYYAYEDPRSAKEVFEFICKERKPNPKIDELVEYFMKKSTLK